MNLSELFSRTGQTLKSTAKAALLSRHCSIRAKKRKGPLIIMGNGPSLRQTIDNDRASLETHDLMAVNFAANAPEFKELKPKYYILIDPFFFSDSDAANLRQLRETLRAVDWPMTLIAPNEFQQKIDKDIAANSSIDIMTINAVGLEGFGPFEKFAYDRRLGMPRPRNVLIPSIMAAIWLGYRDIYITGADHSWMQTISVNSDNEVISVQPHFYKEAEGEQKRVDTTYKGLRLHDVVLSFYIAFKSYHDIARYARKKEVSIYNSSPLSFIDAFPRRPLPTPDQNYPTSE